MKFRFIDAAKEEFPVQRLCKVLEVSQSGYFAWRSRPACERQRDDLVLLAHVRSAFALSNETYGSPRMTHELRDQGLKAGRRRVARLMRENGLRARQPRRFKRTTDSLHAFPVAPNLLDRNFASERPDAVWLACSHGDVIKAILADALGTHLDLFQRIHVDPASVSVVRYTESRPFVIGTNTHAGDLSWLTPPKNDTPLM